MAAVSILGHIGNIRLFPIFNAVNKVFYRPPKTIQLPWKIFQKQKNKTSSPLKDF